MELFHTDTYYSTLILAVFLLDQIAYVGVSPNISLKLFGREIIFEEFQPMWLGYLNVADIRTDDIQSYNRALHRAVKMNQSKLGQQANYFKDL